MYIKVLQVFLSLWLHSESTLTLNLTIFSIEIKLPTLSVVYTRSIPCSKITTSLYKYKIMQIIFIVLELKLHAASVL